MIILQELDELDHTLEFIKVDRIVDIDKERTWKELHNISIVVWNVLFCQTRVPYFAKLFINKRKLKRLYEF